MLKNITHKKTYLMNLFVGFIWLCFSLFFLIVNIHDDLIPSLFFPAAFICLMLTSAPLTAAYILTAKRTQKIEVIGQILNTILLIAFIALYTYVFTGNLSMQKKELAYILPFSFLLIGLPSAINVRMIRKMTKQ
jgi:peptidoglycan/LPS O-acetylase OafA/YrhL